MNKRTEKKLHKRGQATGKVVEFYVPGPKQVPTPTSHLLGEGQISVGDILREVLGFEQGLADVVVLTRSKNSELGLLSNLENEAETLLFLKTIETRILLNRAGHTQQPPPNKGA